MSIHESDRSGSARERREGLAKDDVSRAPESGEKPEAATPPVDGALQAAPARPAGGRPAPVRAKDDASNAPESGDKPEAME